MLSPEQPNCQEIRVAVVGQFELVGRSWILCAMKGAGSGVKKVTNMSIRHTAGQKADYDSSDGKVFRQFFHHVRNFSQS